MDVVNCLEWAQLECHLEMAPGGWVIRWLITSWITDTNVELASLALVKKLRELQKEVFFYSIKYKTTAGKISEKPQSYPISGECYCRHKTGLMPHSCLAQPQVTTASPEERQYSPYITINKTYGKRPKILEA